MSLISCKRRLSIPLTQCHPGSIPPGRSKIFNSSAKRFLYQHFQRWLTPTDHFFVDFHLDMRTSNYDAREYINRNLSLIPPWLEKRQERTEKTEPFRKYWFLPKIWGEMPLWWTPWKLTKLILRSSKNRLIRTQSFNQSPN